MRHLSDIPMRQLFNETQAARYLGITTRTLREWRALGIGPVHIEYTLAPRDIRYDVGLIDRWMNDHLQVHAAEEGTVVHLSDRAVRIVAREPKACEASVAFESADSLSATDPSSD